MIVQTISYLRVYIQTFYFMQVIQSFWSKPLEKDELGFAYYNSRRDFLQSAALSALLIQKHLGGAHLITDEKGAEIFAPIAHLYKKISVELDCLNHIPAYFWAIGKLHCYKLMDEPFVHIDTDIFLGGKIKETNFEVEVLAEEFVSSPPVREMEFAEDLRKADIYLPMSAQYQLLNKNLGYKFINAGIIGGTDLEFFHFYADEAFKFALDNEEYWNTFPSDSFINCTVEQFLLYAELEMEDRQCHYVGTPANLEDPIHLIEKGLDNVNYIHFLRHFKKEYAYKVTEWLQELYPEVYTLIEQHCETLD